MTQALYRKWRPQTFEDMVGQEHIVRALRNALHSEHLHHAYLFAGPRGTGKTSMARLLAKAVNCLAPVGARPCNTCEICRAVNAGRLMDLSEIDGASNTGVDNVRDLLEKVGFMPTQARYKVYVIDEVHMLSTPAFNALLKTLEEPPAHVIFVFATTEAHKILPTVLSRCQRFEFRRIPLDLILERLRAIVTEEGIEAEPEALDLMGRAATGSMRDAISLLDQMAAGGSVTADYVRLMLGAERRKVVESLARAWIEKDVESGLSTIAQAVDGGADPRQLARQLTDFLRGLLLMRLGAGAVWHEPTAEERQRLDALAQTVAPERLTSAVRMFSAVAAERGAGWQPQLPLELAFVEATLSPAPDPSGSDPQAAKPASLRVETSPPPVLPRAAAKREYPAPAPASPAPSALAPVAPAGGASKVETIVSRWQDIKRRMRPVDLSLSALLNDAQPLDVDQEGALVLGFKHSFHRNKADTAENRQAIQGLLEELFGGAFAIRCVLEKEWSPSVSQKAPSFTVPEPPPPPDDPIAGDEVVQRAVTELGAVAKVKA
ncbi:MAG: DNA polymerase III subunit gamma/tau [Anaerolineae bacterium]|nr:DNA polymerase III subunit gamma/tau [Anaerolineae bacterium]